MDEFLLNDSNNSWTDYISTMESESEIIANLDRDISRGHKVLLVICVASMVWATCAEISSMVKKSKGEKVTEVRRVMPFNETSLGTYNKDIDENLKLITATVSLQLKDLCNKGSDVTWESMKAILAQCPALEADQKRVYGEETYQVDKYNETSMSTWIYDFIKRQDGDVFDAARIHDNEIREVIRFVESQTVSFDIFSNTVYSSMDLLDIGMIRFPTKKNPYVKLYRLQLKGTYSGERYMMMKDEKRAITASISSHKYYPRDELLQHIRPENIKNIIDKFESMFK